MPSAAPAVPVLIVDADPVQRRLLMEHLREARFSPLAVSSASEARPHAGAVVVADMDSVGGLGGLGALSRGRSLIATSARPSVATAVDAMRAGAVDFLAKPIGAKALIERLEAVLADHQRDRDQRPPVATADFEGFVGRDSTMQEIYRQIDRIAGSRAPVLVTGESGTGKEVCAEAIHARGGSERPFVVLNCGAIPKDLVESEIFGHVKGAFTGASDDRSGAAELADGGTLFLDEIGETPPAVQVKLLRLIQTGTFQRVGETRTRHADIRFISATNRDPRREVAEGRFREDLYYRLNVLPVRLPPLRERRGDIVALAVHFLHRHAAEEGLATPALAPDAELMLNAYGWPGNVRQLQNVIRRLVVLHRPKCVTPSMLDEALSEFAERDVHPGLQGKSPRVPDIAETLPFHAQERAIIEKAIAMHGGNVARAAAALHLNPSTIYRKLQSWSDGH